MAGFDTVVRVASKFEARCEGLRDPGVELDTYMRLPVDQYVCIKMPLDATLTRVEGNLFDLTVPPVRFFNLDVSPTIHCLVTQNDDAVVIESDSVVLSGSPYVVGLNGCYKIKIRTAFKWLDLVDKQSILSTSSILVEVDPPPPFKYFGRRLLESTGTLALSIALRQIENAFVSSLARDYERWARDSQYRIDRADSCPTTACKLPIDVVDSVVGEAGEGEGEGEGEGAGEGEGEGDAQQTPVAATTTQAIASPPPPELPETSPEKSAPAPAPAPAPAVAVAVAAVAARRPLTPTARTSGPDLTAVAASSFANVFNVGYVVEEENNDGPTVLTDDVCLVPGDPVVRIEEAPSNSRRIFTGIDISASMEDVWGVLVDYGRLDKVIPSLVKNTIVSSLPKGGARLLQVGGAKVLPGVTFTAKILLDVNLYLEDDPLPPNMQASHLPETASSKQVRDYDLKLPLVRGVFPRPYGITSLPHRDITMQNVEGEGDFEHYQGIWRMQNLPNCAVDGGDACRLTYAVEIRPKGFLPVRLIEGRIAADLKANLGAIRQEVEKRKAQRSLEGTGAGAVSVLGAVGGEGGNGVGGDESAAADDSGRGRVSEVQPQALDDGQAQDADFLDAASGVKSVLSAISKAANSEPAASTAPTAPIPDPVPVSVPVQAIVPVPAPVPVPVPAPVPAPASVIIDMTQGYPEGPVLPPSEPLWLLNLSNWIGSLGDTSDNKATSKATGKASKASKTTNSTNSTLATRDASKAAQLTTEVKALRNRIKEMERTRGRSAKAARAEERFKVAKEREFMRGRLAALEREVAQKSALLEAISSVVTSKKAGGPGTGPELQRREKDQEKEKGKEGA